MGSTDVPHSYPYWEALLSWMVGSGSTSRPMVPELLEDLRKGTCPAGGAGPIFSTMLLSPRIGGTAGARLLDCPKFWRCVSGDRNGVVGYVHVFCNNRNEDGSINTSFSNKEKEQVAHLRGMRLGCALFGKEPFN